MVNEIHLIGNLGKDPEAKHLDGGNMVANLAVATSKKYRNKSGERVESTQWHTVVVWRRLAEIAEKYLQKGDTIYIKGEVIYDKYRDKDGNDRIKAKVVANSLQMLKTKGKKSENESPFGNDQQRSSGNEQENIGDVKDPMDMIPDAEDDMPF